MVEEKGQTIGKTKTSVKVKAFFMLKTDFQPTCSRKS